MAKKKTTTGQTSARMVMDVLKKHYAFTPDTAVGYLLIFLGIQMLMN